MMAIKTSNALGVRDFLTFLHPQGDFVSGFIDQDRSLAGIRYHREWQKTLTGECEVPIRFEFDSPRCSLVLIGRIDHLLESRTETLIQEYKTTEIPEDQFGLMPVEIDLEQVKLYAYILAKQNQLPDIRVELLYRHIPKKAVTTFSYSFSMKELEDFFILLWEKFLRWYHAWLDWIEERNESIHHLTFPFASLRHGQSELINQVELHLSQSATLWVEAPTGIGKTMGVLFPAIQQLIQKPFAKIFYLTAKTTQQENALQALQRLKDHGVRLRSIHLVAKEKCCPKAQKICHPDWCEYAKGYFDRIQRALEELVACPSFSSLEARELAEKHRVCPFEFSLDASLWADIIIGDYNYAFDPRVALKRYWENVEFQGILLVDEAHNLLDRAREMYSIELSKRDVYTLYKTYKQTDPKVAKAFRSLHKVFTQAESKEEILEKQYLVQVEAHEPLLEALESLTQSFNQAIQKKKFTNPSSQMLEFLWNAWYALKVFSWYQEETYCTYFTKEKSDLRIKLFCIHPAQLLKKVLEKTIGSVLFSATLTPLEFYRDSLGGTQNDTLLRIESPFSKSRQLVLMDTSLSTRWKDRDKSYSVIQSMIQRAIFAKKGNYIVYFPSYHYLKQVLQIWENPADSDLIVQKEGMKDLEKTEFLQCFQAGRKKTLVAFAVLGGFFSEGIDLVGERLSGVIIVGIGLPQVSLEREIIREYYQQVLEKGYAFAYLYPGLNRVSQAGGRLIRSETDSGFILLIDDRYHQPSTQALLPTHWKPMAKVSQYQALPMILSNFWKSQ
ncbi:MAG: helicase C-terminal domain-containing protein [Caldisericia bacterium]|nr:helicase C-terminal domain-containing protein [Caldisericia bacterium]